MINSAYLALAILGATLGAATFLTTRWKEARVRAEFFAFAQSELNSAMISADRALKNGATPAVARDGILLLLEAVATPEVGRSLMRVFAENADKKAGKPGSENDLSRAIDSLHLKNPALAADIHKAIMGMILAIPVLYADKIKVEALAVQGATNPESLFDRVAKALGGLNGNGKNGGGNLAHC